MTGRIRPDAGHDDRPRNVLWICADQQRFDTLGCLGNVHVDTAHVDALAARGTTFALAHCQAPVCTPSRVSFLTGCYPSRTHVVGNGNAHVPADLPPLVTRRFADAGYTCGLVGKLHLAATQFGRERRTDDGYHHLDYCIDPNLALDNDYHGWLAAQGVALSAVLRPGDGVHHPGYRADVDPALHQTSWCAARADAFIRRHRDQPWLLSVNLEDPHLPFDAPARYLDRYDPDALPGPNYGPHDLDTQRRLAAVYFQSPCRPPDDRVRAARAAYLAMIDQIDVAVGTILDTLAETGQLDRTIVVYTSDHGEMLGDHGLLAKGCRFYEGLVRVPLVIAVPGQRDPGRVVDDLVELTDLAPTLAELCDLDLPDAQGRSLAHHLDVSISDRSPREHVRCEYLMALDSTAPMDFPEVYGRTHHDVDQAHATMFRTAQHKLVTYHSHGLGELYDLREDPDETVDRWDDPAYASLRADLILAAFDATVLAADPGPPRVAYY